MADAATDTPDSLLAALDAGTLQPPEYVRRAREIGVDTGTVAAAVRKHKDKATLEAAAAADGGAPEEASAISDPPASGAEASLAWLRARPGNWGSRSAERLGPGNDFLFDLELYDSCQIDDEAAGHIATALAANTTVTEINLTDNQIGDAGAEQLFQAVQSSGSVTSLDLTRNRIGAASVDVIVRSLTADGCPLQRLVLCANPGFEAEETKAALRQAWGERDAAKLEL